MRQVEVKRVPHIRQQVIKKQTMQQLICNRLEWSEEQYNQFQLDAGCEFVNYIMDVLADSERSLILASKLFWGWWCNQWYVRDCAVYTWPVLTDTNYQYVHTFNLQDCQPTINSFWNHVADMINEGRKKQIKEAGNEVHNEL